MTGARSRKRRLQGTERLMVSEAIALARAAVGRLVDWLVYGSAIVVLTVASLLGVEDLDR